ncbi:hypothetical protein ACFO4M_07210 [Pseudonocardia nematodicida]
MGEVAHLLRQVELTTLGLSESELGYDTAGLLHAYPQWAAAIFEWNITIHEGHRYASTGILSREARDALASTHNTLRSAAREGVLPRNSRDEILTQVSETISEVLGQVQTEDQLPEWSRIQLAAKLTEVREAIRNIRFRGDQAVGDALIGAVASFGTMEDPKRHLPNHGAKSPLHIRIESWSTTLKTTAQNYYSALASPLAISYFLATSDPLGAGLILATQSPEAIAKATQALLGRSDPQITDGSDGSTSAE